MRRRRRDGRSRGLDKSDRADFIPLIPAPGGYGWPYRSAGFRLRGLVEHLHENKHLEVFDRNARLELVKKLEMMEFIARSALVRIVLDRNLWPHFANTAALQAFWALDDQQRSALWGTTIDPTDALIGFDPSHINNGQ